MFMNKRVNGTVLAAVVAVGLLLGCGGNAETASTDTAVTETVAPEAVTESPDAAESTVATESDEAATPQEEAPTDTGTSGASGEN
jgi:outer membrane murein-binding lipoprotein Lpp